MDSRKHVANDLAKQLDLATLVQLLMNEQNFTEAAKDLAGSV